MALWIIKKLLSQKYEAGYPFKSKKCVLMEEREIQLHGHIQSPRIRCLINRTQKTRNL